MRLASIKSGRDGRLVVLTPDGMRFAEVPDIAVTLREALDNWEQAAPLLAARAAMLGGDPAQGLPVAGVQFAAPLPRASAWLDGSTFFNHIRLMNRAMGTEVKPAMLDMPLMYQGGSDDLLGPNDPILVADAAWGIDLEAELGVVVDDVPMGTTADHALAYVKLILLLNDVSLRNLQPRELMLGFGMLQAKPSTAFAPFAVTPDEFGKDWADGRLNIEMRSSINGTPIGRPRASIGMVYGFAQLIEHAARTRRLSAGTIIGSGTISNEQPIETARIEEGGVGFSCLSEARAIDMIRTGAAETSFLHYGDRVVIEAVDSLGRSLFGRIDQVVEHPAGREQAA